MSDKRRFEFGKNWQSFIALLDAERIAEARKSLTEMLNTKGLKGKSFLDIGSGSGLFSLVARQLEAHVHSFDYDPASVECTSALKQRYFPGDRGWTIERGSVLDVDYLRSLGTFDIVYSWGVLHHTGDMWRALENVVPLVAGEGRLFISIYNDQGWMSKYWKIVKTLYNRNIALRSIVICAHIPYLLGIRFIVRLATGRLKSYRGMSLWYDMKDWLGGYPFEVATPESIRLFYQKRGFVLEEIKTCGRRHGCNEFVFKKISLA